MLFALNIAFAAESCGPTGCPAPVDAVPAATSDLIRPAAHLRTATFALG